MDCVSCLGLPTKGNSHLLFTCEKGYVATPVARHQRRRRRSTSQHKTRDTNAGGGGVRRNTKRVTPTPKVEEYVATPVTPTPEEEEYVATQDPWHQRRRRRSTSQHKTRDTNAGGGGVRRNTRPVTPTPEEEEYVATQGSDTNAGGGVCCHHSKVISYPHVFSPPKFSYFLYQSFNFFLLLSCVVMTLNISFIRIVYCIQHFM